MGHGISSALRTKPKDPWTAHREAARVDQGNDTSVATVAGSADGSEENNASRSLVAFNFVETQSLPSPTEGNAADRLFDDDTFVIDEDDDLGSHDLERIEADYRAARARAIFSAGAAVRVAKLERMRHKTEMDQKRKAETEWYTKQIEIKAIQLQATMLEQKCILTWGPVALETGRLDKEAIIQIRDGIRKLNETVADLECLSHLNTPRTQPHSESASPRMADEGACWPKPSPSPRPDDHLRMHPPSSMSKMRPRPWSWKGRLITEHKVHRVISECINSWNPMWTEIGDLPGDSSVNVKDHFAAFLDTPRLEVEDPWMTGEVTESKGGAEGVEKTAACNGDLEQLTSEQVHMQRVDECDTLLEETVQTEDCALRSPIDPQEVDDLHMSIDLGKDAEGSGVRVSPHSVKSPVSIQQTTELEDERFCGIHQMWAPSSRSLDMSGTMRESLFQMPQTRHPGSPQSIISTHAKQIKVKVLKERGVKLPRILGLDKFQDAFEMRCNLASAEDYIDENLILAANVRELICSARRKLDEKPCRSEASHTVAHRRQSTEKSRELRRTGSEDNNACNTIADEILYLQDEVADLEATFRVCQTCAGHFTRKSERRGPAPAQAEKSRLEGDLEKLACFAANEIQPALRNALNAAVAAAHSTVEQDHLEQSAIKQSVMRQLESEPSSFYSTRLRKIAAIPSELEAELIMKRSRARSDLIVNLKCELVAYQKMQDTDDCADLSKLHSIRNHMFQKVTWAKDRRELMKRQLASTLKIQGIWRGISCRESFRKQGIHISSPLEEHARGNLLPELEKIMKSKVAVRREMDHTIQEERIFAGMVNEDGDHHGWGCMIFPKSDKQQRVHYMGEFVKGSMQGVGVLTFHKGARYEGQFSDNMPHGFGIEIYVSGAIYQGQFEHDRRHGLGIYTFPSGISYGGSWFRGFQHGEGVETNINVPSNPVRPKSELLQKLSDMSRLQNDCMKSAETAMANARDLAIKGDQYAVKQAVKESMDWMDKTLKFTKEIRLAVESQEHSVRKLVRYSGGQKVLKKVVDPNLLATEILEGGWVELNIGAPVKSFSEAELLPRGHTDALRRGTSQEHKSHHQDDGNRPHQNDHHNSSEEISTSCSSHKKCVDEFFLRFPDAESGPLKPGEPALVVADENVNMHWSLFQIQIKTEEDVLWWYQREALRPAQPSLKAQLRRDQESYELEMEQRELDEIRIEDIMIQMAYFLQMSVYFADWAKDGAAQTAAACSDLLQAIQRMPTLKSVDPKTHDGAEFLRALKKHRELQKLEEAKSKAQYAEEESPETFENENQGGNGKSVRLHASDASQD